ncbi:MAG: selenium metabolism-associated LysR family transcriptional regulator [Ktedonobacterales bacterium]
MDQQLRLFTTVVEQRGFSRAAAVLHMTQPAVSQQVQALERDLGAQLLERTNKYLRLTPAGEIVYEHARQILDLEQRMRRYVDDLMQVASGPLTIGASYTIGEYLLPRILAAFQAQYPQVVPAVTIANTQRVAELVATRRIDVGLVEGQVDASLLDARPLLEDQLIVVSSSGSPRLQQAQRAALQPSELAGETLIVREEGSGTRAVTDAFFAQTQLQPAAILAFGSTQMIKGAVEAGMGVSLLSWWAVRAELALGVLAELPVTGTPCSRQFSAITPRSRFRTKAVDLFLHELGASIAALESLIGRHPR